MRWLCFLVLAGCGRLGFESARSGDASIIDDADASRDAVVCGAFGDVKATFTFPRTQSQIIDSNRFVVTASNINVVVNTNLGTEMFKLDHALNDLGAPTMFSPVGNLSVSLDPVDGLIYAAGIETTNSQVSTHDLAGTLVTGPMTSGRNLMAGAVGPDGHVHWPDVNTPGIYEYSPTLGFVQAWGSAARNARDMAYDHVTGVMYHLGAFEVRGFDMLQTTRPEVINFPPPSTMTDGIAIDDARGRLYINRRGTHEIFVYALDGTMLDDILFADDPSTVEFDPFTDRLVLGFLHADLMTSHVSLVCPKI